MLRSHLLRSSSPWDIDLGGGGRPAGLSISNTTVARKTEPRGRPAGLGIAGALGHRRTEP
eukprot:1282502-Lingulodinium_polyedra.AAC.1